MQLRVCLLLASVWLTVSAHAAPKVAFDAPSRVNEAISRGVDFLVGKQADDGSIADRDYRNAITAWSALAIAAAGHQASDSTPEGEALRRANEYLLRTAGPPGNRVYFGNNRSKGMYEHAMTTIALAEMLVAGADKGHEALIRSNCQGAVELILSAQKVNKRAAAFGGGWRYSPDSLDSDVSVTIWQMMALRSAMRAGLTVPQSALVNGAEYIKRSYLPPGNKTGMIGFAYTPATALPTFANLAGGLRALLVSGEKEVPEVTEPAEWLKANPPFYDQSYFFLSTYYYALALQGIGGEAAQAAQLFVARVLLETQHVDGSWLGENSETSLGPSYCTAMAVLSLSVRNQKLPMFRY